VLSAEVTDKANDVTPSPADRPPVWADLISARLERAPDGFTLRVRLGGGAAPSTTDEDHTMNVASFYDVDGDGQIDFEIWANLASGGWGGSWYDDTAGGGAQFGDESGVTIETSGPEIVVRFPLSNLGDATSFRWSVASEWGRYETLGTTLMARDDMPDNDAAVQFPA
jgi:hypothetical protein